MSQTEMEKEAVCLCGGTSTALLPVQSPVKGHGSGDTGNSTHHICSLILLPSSSMVLILKSIPERKGRIKGVIKARPLPGLPASADNRAVWLLEQQQYAGSLESQGPLHNKTGSFWKYLSLLEAQRGQQQLERSWEREMGKAPTSAASGPASQWAS